MFCKQILTEKIAKDVLPSPHSPANHKITGHSFILYFLSKNVSPFCPEDFTSWGENSSFLSYR
jgi:hypothetical protein